MVLPPSVGNDKGWLVERLTGEAKVRRAPSEQVDIEFGVRTLNREVRDRVETRIREIVQGQAAAFNVEVEIDYTLLAPVIGQYSKRNCANASRRSPGIR